jgi:hypothetical protein
MFWVALFLFAIGLIAVLWGTLSDSRDSGTGKGVGAFLLLLGGVFTVIACTSVVDARNIGVVTSFKKPTGATTGSGLQWTKPWETVQDWDATSQVFDHGNERSCISVRIAGGGQGCVELTVGWRAAVPRGPENFAAYRPVGDASRFDVFTDRRVNRPITAEVGSLFTTFDAFQGISADKIDSGGLPPAPDLNKLYRQQLTDRLNLVVGGGILAPDGKTVQVDKDNPATKNEFEDDPDADIVVTSVTFGYIRYDDATNQKLAAYGQKLLENRNLQVDKANAGLRKEIAGESGLTPFQKACLEQAGAYAGLCGGGNGSQVILPAK